ncbi:hypothetical protein BD770DRAFT_327089 [Pilaira anomala]|nr:hypothetical protein BD770DRAFT_327089 [Pilaira anomala]
MSRPFAVAFQSTRHALIAQTRLKTLELYKSLLRSSEKFEHANVLQQVIRNKFKKNINNTSRSKVLDLLAEGNKVNKLSTLAA